MTRFLKMRPTMLEKNGISVVKYTVINDTFDQAGILGKIAMTGGMLWSFKNYKKDQGDHTKRKTGYHACPYLFFHFFLIYFICS